MTVCESAAVSTRPFNTANWPILSGPQHRPELIEINQLSPWMCAPPSTGAYGSSCCISASLEVVEGGPSDVIYWTCCGLAAVAVTSIGIWLIGRAARYVLANR